MILKNLTFAAALVAASALTAYAQSDSSNPAQAPSQGAASTPGGTAKPDSPGPAANMPGHTSKPNNADPAQNSSTPAQAPTTGAGARNHPDLRPGMASPPRD